MIASADEANGPTIFLKVGYNNGQGGGVQFADGTFTLGTPFTDCNNDSLNDPDQIAAGTLTDCDGDLIPDICEGATLYDASQSFAFATATPVEVTFTDLPPAYAGTPRIEIAVTAYLGATNDALIVQLDGGAGTTLFLTNGTDCPATPDLAVIERALP